MWLIIATINAGV